MKDNNLNFEEYEAHYSKDSFFDKILKQAQKAGLKVIYSGLLLYYATQRPDMPTHIKATIVGALGYFVLPFDLVPDIAPVVGYGDDAAVLAGALLMASMYIDDGVKGNARKKLKEFFVNIDESELIDIEETIVKTEEDKKIDS